MGCPHCERKTQCNICKYLCKHYQNRYDCLECGYCTHRNRKALCRLCKYCNVCNFRKKKGVCLLCDFVPDYSKGLEGMYPFDLEEKYSYFICYDIN